MSNSKHCTLGRDPERCVVVDIASVLPKGIGGNDHKRLCPCHDDTEASLSINAGKKGQRVVWCCHAGCDPAGVRQALLDLGIDESCLGNYAKPWRVSVPNLHVPHLDAALVADVKRCHAIAKVPMGTAGHFYKMCVQAILESGGEVPSDPVRLLPDSRDEFVSLARRCGFNRTYAYKLWDKWEADYLKPLSLVA